MAFQLPYKIPPILHLVNHGSRCSQGQEKQEFPMGARVRVEQRVGADVGNGRKIQICEF